jgi:energy-coupling factor transporter ATP-binding protein EcfA2
MAKKYTIKEILVERAPGFQRSRFPEIKTLTSSLNVIWGPNGIGKTTLAKSLFSLLWKQNRAEKFEVVGNLACEDELWKSEVREGSLTQIRLSDDQKIALPGRNDEMSNIYWFSLSDFLSGEGNRPEFHQKVYQEMQGGVNIEQAAVEAGAIDKFTVGRKNIIRSVKSAKIEYGSARKKQAEVQELSEKIEETKALIKSIEDSKSQLVYHEKALEFTRLNQTIRACEQKKGDFSKQIQNVTEYSYDKFEQLSTGFKSKIKEVEGFETAIERLKEKIENCKVTPEQLKNPSIVTHLNEMISDFELKDREKKDSKSAFQKIENQLKVWEGEHDWLTSKLPNKGKLIAAIDTLKQFSNDFESLRSQLAAMGVYKDLLGPKVEIDNTTDKLNELKTRIGDLLEKYITYESLQKGIELLPGVRKRIILWVTLILFVSLGLSVVFHPLFSLLAMFVPVLIWRVLPSRRQNSDVADAFKTLQDTQKKVNGLLEDFGWTISEELNPEELSSKLREIETRIGAIESGIKKNAERDVAEEKYNIAQKKLKNRFSDWEEACRDIGLDPNNPKLDGAQFFNFTNHLKKWIELIAEKETAKVSLNESEKDFTIALTRLKNFLNFDQDDKQQLMAEAKSLIDRIGNARTFIESLNDEKRKHILSCEDRAKAEEKLQEFWVKMDIDPPDDNLLRSLSGKRKEWDQINQEIEFAYGKIESLKESYPISLKISSEKSSEEIQSSIDELTEKITVLPKLYEGLTNLKSSYNNFVEGSSLATAERKYKQALHNLEQLRQEQVFGRIVDMISKKIETESRSSEVPEVLKHASSWLERITSNRYQLRANRDEFFAYDTVLKENLSLEQLSDGTRVQLLFAIRMGFISVQEMSTDLRMPIFMDELLANSDEEKALKIISAIREIARNRQVFYFTAQADEVEKFRQHAKDVFSDISLANLFKVSQVLQNPLIQHLHVLPDIPKPKEDYYEYGKTLEVSAQSLWDEIEELHSWYLFNDSDLLFQDLTEGRVRIGQLNSSDEQIAIRIDLLRDAQALARIGRCRSLSISDLANAPIGLNTKAQYWRDIKHVLEKQHGSGDALKVALHNGSIQRVNKKKQEILDWMVENGFLSEENKMSIDQILGSLIGTHAFLSQQSDDYQVIERYLHQVISE